jgi:hypothetical protein
VASEADGGAAKEAFAFLDSSDDEGDAAFKGVLIIHPGIGKVASLHLVEARRELNARAKFAL